MVDTIDSVFVDKFADDFHLLAEARKSRLTPYTRRKPGTVTGRSFTIDTLGNSDATPNRPRHSDLVYQDLEKARRFALMNDLEPAAIIDSMDKLKMLIDPTNGYSQKLVNDCNRFHDKIIINALLNPVSLESGGTSALPNSQIITASATGLTMAKLRQAKALLDNAEMDDSDFFSMMGQHEASQVPFGNLAMPSYVIVCSTNQINNMLATTEATSQDYNTVKALASGSLNTFMGFLFIRVPDTYLPKVSTTRSIVAYAPRALEFGVGKEPTARVDFLAHKNAYQVLAETSVGAGRAEDLGVVQIDCIES